MKVVEMMNEFQILKGEYMKREAGPQQLPLQLPKRMPIIQEENDDLGHGDCDDDGDRDCDRDPI